MLSSSSSAASCVLIGDIVTIKSLKYHKYLTANGLLDEELYIGENQIFDNNLFQVCIPRQYTAAMELDEFMEKELNGNLSNANDYSLRQLTALRRGAMNEYNLNSLSFQSKIGTPLHYGDEIQLLHLNSKKYVTIIGHEVALLERENIRVRLHPQGTEDSWLTLQPRFKITQNGDLVFSNSEVKFNVVERNNEFLHITDKTFPLSSTTLTSAGPASSSPRRGRSGGRRKGNDSPSQHQHHSVREVNASLEPSTWFLSVYQSASCFSSSFSPDNILTTDLIYFCDPETQSYLSVICRPVHITPYGSANGDDELSDDDSLLEMSVDGEIVLEKMDSLQSNALWSIEKKNRSIGGPIIWASDHIRLRHINTGQYLAMKVSRKSPGSEEDEDEEVGDEEGDDGGNSEYTLTVTSNYHEKCTLFSLHELYGSAETYLTDKRAVQLSHGPHYLERGALREIEEMSHYLCGSTRNKFNATYLFINKHLSKISSDITNPHTSLTAPLSQRSYHHTSPSAHQLTATSAGSGPIRGPPVGSGSKDSILLSQQQPLDLFVGVSLKNYFLSILNSCEDFTDYDVYSTDENTRHYSAIWSTTTSSSPSSLSQHDSNHFFHITKKAVFYLRGVSIFEEYDETNQLPLDDETHGSPPPMGGGSTRRGKNSFALTGVGGSARAGLIDDTSEIKNEFNENLANEALIPHRQTLFCEQGTLIIILQLLNLILPLVKGKNYRSEYDDNVATSTTNKSPPSVGGVSTSDSTQADEDYFTSKEIVYQRLQLLKHVNLVSNFLFRLLFQSIKKNLKNQLAISGHLHVILGWVGVRHLAGDVVQEMLRDHKELQASKIGLSEIQIFTTQLVSGDMKLKCMYLAMLRAFCSCGGCGVSRNQGYVLEAVTPLMATIFITFSINSQMKYEPLYDRHSFIESLYYPPKHQSLLMKTILGVSLLEEGTPTLSITWTCSQPEYTPLKLFNQKMVAIRSYFKPQRSADANLASNHAISGLLVGPHVLKTFTPPQLKRIRSGSFVEVNTSNVRQQRNQRLLSFSSLSLKDTMDNKLLAQKRKDHILEYLISQFELQSELCLDRNYRSIYLLEKIMPYESMIGMLTVYGVSIDDLPATVVRFLGSIMMLIRTLYVDRKCENTTARLPCKSILYDDLIDDPLPSAPAPSALLSTARPFSGTSLPSVPLDEVYKFSLLQTLIGKHLRYCLRGGGGANGEAVHIWSSHTLNCLLTLQKLIQLNYYGTPEKLLDVIPLLVELLNRLNPRYYDDDDDDLLAGRGGVVGAVGGAAGRVRRMSRKYNLIGGIGDANGLALQSSTQVAWQEKVLHFMDSLLELALMMILMIISTIVTFTAIFDSQQSLHFLILNLIISCIFFAEITLRLYCHYCTSKSAQTESGGVTTSAYSKPFHTILLTDRFIQIDIAVIILDIILYTLEFTLDQFNSLSNSLRVIRFVRFIRIIRIFRIFRFVRVYKLFQLLSLEKKRGAYAVHGGGGGGAMASNASIKWQEPERYRKATAIEIDTMIAAVNCLETIQNILHSRNLTILMKGFRRWSSSLPPATGASGGTTLSPAALSSLSNIFEDVSREINQITILHSTNEIQFLDLLMYHHPKLVQSVLELMMSSHHTISHMLSYAHDIQLIVSSSSHIKKYELVKKLLLELNHHIETFPLWGTLNTPHDEEISERCLEILLTLRNNCRLPLQTLQFHQKYQPDVTMQNLLRNFSCWEISHQLLLKLHLSNDGNTMNKSSKSTQNILKATNNLLYWYTKDHKVNQSEVFLSLDYFLMTLDKGIDSHHVITSIFSNNEILMKKISKHYIHEFINRICESGRLPQYLTILSAITSINNNKNIIENQYEIIKHISSPLRQKKILLFFCSPYNNNNNNNNNNIQHQTTTTTTMGQQPGTSGGTSGGSSNTATLGGGGGGAGGGNVNIEYQRKVKLMAPYLHKVDPSPEDIAVELYYHIELLRVLTGCTLGINNLTTIETKVQAMFNYLDIIDSILDPQCLLLIKIETGLFFYHAILDVEMQLHGLQHSDHIWNLMEYFIESPLTTAKDEIRFIERNGWNHQKVSRQKVEFVVVAVMIVKAFFEVYFDFDSFKKEIQQNQQSGRHGTSLGGGGGNGGNDLYTKSFNTTNTSNTATQRAGSIKRNSSSQFLGIIPSSTSNNIDLRAEITATYVEDIISQLFSLIRGIYELESVIFPPEHQAMMYQALHALCHAQGKDVDDYITATHHHNHSSNGDHHLRDGDDVDDDHQIYTPSKRQTQEKIIYSNFKDFLNFLDTNPNVQQSLTEEFYSFLTSLTTLPHLHDDDGDNTGSTSSFSSSSSLLRYEPLLHKLVTHIRSSTDILSYTTGRIRQLSVTQTQTTIWIIKLFRHMIESVWGMTIDERDEQGGEEQDHASAQIVETLNTCGVTTLCLDLIAIGIENELIIECVKLCVAMLYKEGGALVVQEVMFHHLNTSKDSELFFRQIKKTLQELISWHDWRGIKYLQSSSTAPTHSPTAAPAGGGGAGVGEGKGDGSKRKKDETEGQEREGAGGGGEEVDVMGLLPPEFILIKFLQLMCEGHYLPNQDIMREQRLSSSSSSSSSYNILEDLSQYYICLNHLPCRVSNVAALSVGATILEVIQGPCEGNQSYFALNTVLIEIINKQLRSRVEGDCLLFENLQLKKCCVDILLGLLEGQGKKANVFERVLSVLHLDVIHILSSQAPSSTSSSSPSTSPIEDHLSRHTPPDDDLLLFFQSLFNPLQNTFLFSLFSPLTTSSETEEIQEIEQILKTKCLVLLQVLSDHKSDLLPVTLPTPHGYHSSSTTTTSSSSSSSSTSLPAPLSADSSIACVEIMWRGELQRRFYTLPSLSFDFNETNKSHFVETVNRSSQENKLLDLYKKAHEIYIELLHQQLLQQIKISQIFSRENQNYATWITFGLCCFINLLMLIYYNGSTCLDHYDLHNSSSTYQQEIECGKPDLPHHVRAMINILNYLQIIFSSFTLLMFLIVRAPVQYLIHRQDHPLIGSILLTAVDPQTLYYFIYVILAVISLQVDHLSTLFLLDIVMKNSYAMDVLIAVFKPIRQLMMASLLFIVVGYIFAMVLVSETPHPLDHDLLSSLSPSLSLSLSVPLSLSPSLTLSLSLPPSPSLSLSPQHTHTHPRSSFISTPPTP
jgi:hypothetical protein